MENKKLPNFLQPFLWSVNTAHLDLENDKVQIIHHILAFGNLKALKWLFRVYFLREIRTVFLSHSYRIYRDSTFNFTTRILLNINKPLNTKKYVVDSF